MTDPNLQYVYRVASQLLQPSNQPSSLVDVNVRAAMVNEINSPLIAGDKPSSAITPLYLLNQEEINLRLQNVTRITKSIIHDIPEDVSRVNIALRIWSGCMDASKHISFRTMDGSNTPDNRYIAFLCIDFLSSRDLLYKAGVETAPSFRKLKQQYYSFEGIPPDSHVRSYPNEFLLDG